MLKKDFKKQEIAKFEVKKNMKNLSIYQVDAFSEKVFGGNPAAVVLLPHNLNLGDEVLQQIAAENNLSETAFLLLGEVNQISSRIKLRWFTPKAEVNLCGHATLASAFVYFNYINKKTKKVIFSTKSGDLACELKEGKISIELPKDEIKPLSVTKEFKKLTHISPIEAYAGREDLLLVYKNEVDIVNAIPNLSLIEKINYRGLIVTSRGKKVDVVSRFFTPQLGINEDPVTGSAHTTLAAYWSLKLDKKNLICQQLSERSGIISLQVHEQYIELRGNASLYLKGEIYVDD